VYDYGGLIFDEFIQYTTAKTRYFAYLLSFFNL